MALEYKLAAVCRVKQYEGKLATLSVFNDALQKENTQLREELEETSAPRSATEQEVVELKQEFTRRMAAADKDISRLKVSAATGLLPPHEILNACTMRAWSSRS